MNIVIKRAHCDLWEKLYRDDQFDKMWKTNLNMGECEVFYKKCDSLTHKTCLRKGSQSHMEGTIKIMDNGMGICVAESKFPI